MLKEESFILDSKIYPLKIIKRAIYKNLSFASFFLISEKLDQFKLFIIKRKKNFEISNFFDDLNYYNFLDSENKKAEPVLESILHGIKCHLKPHLKKKK